MAHITNCTLCGNAYEETSEENANDPYERLCPNCFKEKKDICGCGETKLARLIMCRGCWHDYNCDDDLE